MHKVALKGLNDHADGARAGAGSATAHPDV